MTLQSLARFLARFDALGVDPARFCIFIIYQGERGTVAPEDIASEFDIHYDAGERLLRYAADFGMASYDRPDDPRVTVNRNATTRFMHFLEVFDANASEQERTMLREGAYDQLTFLSRVPDAATNLQGTETDLLGALSRIVGDAETSLVLVTPFINEMGSKTLVERVGHATVRGVDVTIVTRDTDSNNETEIDQLVESVKDEGDPERLSIYDFGAEDARLHAKAIVCDEEVAYIGSANMTSYSLREAVEVGIVIEGPSVAEVSSFFERVAGAPQTTRVF